MDQNSKDSALPPETFQEFLAISRTGYAYVGPDGRILFVNGRVADWLQTTSQALVGTRLLDHFPMTRRVYFETHLAPLLKMQGFFDEVALDLCRPDGARLPVLVSARERHDKSGSTRFVCFTFFPAIERRKFERNLVATKGVVAADNSRLREQVAEHARERLKVEETLSSTQEAAVLREQFIAVLGHDLRNPLAAVDGGMRLLAKTPLTERAVEIVSMVKQSVARMADLIDNLMDFAHGRLGSGVPTTLRSTDLAPLLEHVVRELQINWPDRSISTELQLPSPVYCDGKRIAQLLSNLVANALTHGDPEGPVKVVAKLDKDRFELAVHNTGEPIPEAAMDRLFQPFTREDVRPTQQGLGLGLYIASEIARAHRGHLRVRSSSKETCFSFAMQASAGARATTQADQAEM